MPSAARPWFLYLIECANGAWYAGISPDVDARYRAHASGRGARYTRANPPVRLLGTRAYPDRASAARAEWAIRKLPRARKLAFLADVAVGPGADEALAPDQPASRVPSSGSSQPR